MSMTHNGALVDADLIPEAGDVPNSELGIGYDPEVLDRQAELDELAEFELTRGGAQPSAVEEDPDVFPDEEDEAEDEPVPTPPPVAASRPRLHAAQRRADPGHPLSMTKKVWRTGLFAALGALITALLPIFDSIAQGKDVSLSLVGSLAIAGIAGAIAAGARAGVAYLPVFPDDDVGVER